MAHYWGHLYIYIWAHYEGLIMYIYGCLYGCLYIWANYWGHLYIWVWFFINKNMIKIEK